MKNTLFKKVLAVALACTMTFSMATVTHAADAKEITIGVTSFADTLEPTEQYFSWVVSRYAIGECLTKFDEEEKDGYITCGKVVFNNGLTVTAAFYK